MALNFETAVRMLAFLRENSPVELAVVSKVFEISDKEVRRYCALLNEAKTGEEYGELVDVEIQDDEDGVWIELFESQGIGRQIRFSPEESVAIVGGLKYLDALPELVDGETLGRLIIKVQQALGTFEEIVQIGTSEVSAQNVQILRDAIASGKCVQMEYGGATRQVISSRLVEPKTLLAVDGVLYVRCYCHSSDAPRTFRIDRILNVQLTDQVGNHELAQATDLEISEPAIEARLRMLPEMIESFAPETLSEQVVTGNRIEVTAHLTTESWLIQLVLASAGDIEIVAPQSLRELVQVRAQSWLHKHAIN